VLPLARRELPFRLLNADQFPAAGQPVVVAIGGGALLDRAKLWRRAQSPNTRLIAVPTLWGSGADASPVAVWTADGRKAYVSDPELLPHDRCVWRDLANHVPPDAARWGFGDIWAHALEALLSPLASSDLRLRLRDFVVRQLLPMPLEADSAWFDLAATAGCLQAQAGVGLVHGIAHELEPRMADAHAGPWGHARLCSAMLLPVMQFNTSSAKVRELIGQLELPWEDVLRTIARLGSREDGAIVAPLVATHWAAILRNPLTRTNSALVRPDTLALLHPWSRPV
jgi:alcohol dehydrogenase class IV